MPRVLIAGCGYLGRAAADLFQDNGWEVEGWVARASSLRNRSPQAGSSRYRLCAVDISDRAAVPSATGEFEVVIHCASTGGAGPEAYRRLYLEGARNLLEKLQPAKFIFSSSTSVYAQSDGQWVDEESAAAPGHETGRVLREAEELVRQNRGTVARLAGIYGPGRSALLKKFLSGEARLEGGGKRFLNQAHRDDIAAAFLLLARLPAPSLVNIVDDEPLTQRAAYAWLAARLGRPLPPPASPPSPRKRGASNKRVRNTKLRALGWTPRFPNFVSGMENSVLPAAGLPA